MNFASFLEIIPYNNLRQVIQYAVLSVLLTSCLGTKFLKENEVIISKEAKVRGIRSGYRDEIRQLVVQQPNERFLQLPIAYGVYSYSIGEREFEAEEFERKIDETREKFDRKIEKSSSEKRVSRLRSKRDEKVRKLELKVREGNWLMQNGEALSVLDTNLFFQSRERIQIFLKSRGYFDSKVAIDSRRIGELKSRILVNISPGEQFTIDSMQHVIADPGIEKLYTQTFENSLMEKGMAYDQEVLEAERTRIYNVLVNNGFYGFSSQLITFTIDTLTLHKPNILLTTRIANPTGIQPKQFRLDSVIFLSESNLDVSRLESTSFKDVTYRFGDRKYDPQVLDWRLFITKDSLFSTEATLETQKQLSYMDAFRYVNINYDSTMTDGLVASVFTSPLNRFQTNYEVGGISSGQLPGPFFNIGLKNRNTFGGLEITNFTASTSLQGISSVGDRDNYTLVQYSGELSITFPQILFPARENFKYRIGRFNPKTQLIMGYNYEDRLREYERSFIQGTFRYIWSVRNNVQYIFSPVSLTFIDVNRLTNSFSNFLQEQADQGNGTLQAAFRSSFISSSSFETIFNFNEYSTYQSNSAFLRLFAETGGNFIGELTQRLLPEENSFSFFKWIKFNADFRALGILSSSESLAFRFNIGAAYPYENSNLSLPYDKRFYVGGSNSLRGWPIRRLGPGAYGESREPYSIVPRVSEISYRLEQGGDMVIETNIEYRKKLFRYIDYALFLDVGNIWLINSDQQLMDDEGDDGVFRISNFYKELAANIGMGLRIDFSFLVFRLDGAMQVVDPAQVEGQRFVLDNINLLAPFGGSAADKSFFSNKTNLSIGIGFPF